MGTIKRRQQQSAGQEKVIPFLASFFVHGCLFIILGLTFQQTESRPKIVLQISSSENPVDVELENDFVVDLDPQIFSDSKVVDPLIDTQIDHKDLSSNIDFPVVEKTTKKAEKSPDLKNKTASSTSPKTLKNGSGKGNLGLLEQDARELDRRLRQYNAGSGDIQISIMWSNYNDIDLWVEYNDGYFTEQIGWNNKVGNSGGYLDIDANIYPSTNKPIENIFFAKAPRGSYSIYVNYYHQWDNAGSTPVLIRIKNGNNISYKKHILRYGQLQKIIVFQY